jgi:hypothetical protein
MINHDCLLILRVIGRIVIMASYVEPVPAQAIAEISHEAGIEGTDASAGMAEVPSSLKSQSSSA